MDDIKELIEIISKRKLSQIDIFDKSLISQKDTLFSKLYDGVASGEIKTDDDAVKYLYVVGNELPTENNKVAYRRLKSRFKQRLYNTLYFLDLNQTNLADLAKKDYAFCLNKLYLSNLLLRYADNRNASITLVMEAYPIAQKYNFYDLLKEFSFKLLIFYGMNGKTKQYNEEIIRYENFKKEYELEQSAQLIYSKIYLMSNMTKYDPEILGQQMLVEIDKLIPLYQASSSINTYFSYIRSKLFYFEKFADNVNMIAVCDEFLKNYNNYKSSLLLQNYTDVISLHKLKSLFDVRELQKSNELAMQLESNARSLNWLTVKEFQFKANLNYQINRQVLDIAEEVMSSQHYKSTTNPIKERWLLYHAYALLMFQHANQITYKINIKKLDNQLETLSQDKAEFNLSFRILEIIYAIALNDLDTAADKISLLEAYQKRHIKHEKYNRFILFLSLLTQAEKRGFNYKELAKLKPYLTLKENFRMQYINMNEIVFFDKLWEIILDMLKTNNNKLFA